MPHTHGKRRGTRSMFAKKHRQHGRPTLSNYLAVIKMGDYVDVKVDGSVAKGMPHKYYHGRTGTVCNVTPRGLSVLINKRVRHRIIRKKICIRHEHVRKSRCQEDFKARVKHNEMVRQTGVGKRIKRLPEQPKPFQTVATKNRPLRLGMKKFVFSQVYSY
eukprot:NODE_5883_length_598_cov_133.025478_g5718_i0.p1 GENE.NODE_5883_length_598_cov_133.025478_g5718_i0~~NODE_5883_length_598_cov_133.025478_g5718_i0.p1  ORF type:complete len:182 (+),score=29.99 NODE_5883_length_598_cov_133.025478_g5718_i0:67-546(+)